MVQGFWTQGTPITPGRMNQMLWQRGSLFDRPAASASNKLMVWVNTDDNTVTQSNGVSWEEFIPGDGSANQFTLRSLGDTEFQGSPGNHGHVVDEVDTEFRVVTTSIDLILVDQYYTLAPTINMGGGKIGDLLVIVLNSNYTGNSFPTIAVRVDGVFIIEGVPVVGNLLPLLGWSYVTTISTTSAISVAVLAKRTNNNPATFNQRGLYLSRVGV